MIVDYYETLASTSCLLLTSSSGLNCLLLLSLLGGSGLGLLGLGLVNQDLSLDGLSLSLVDSLNQNSLVLELVTLGLHVEVVINVVINLSLLSVLAEKTSENSLSSDPHDLGGHASLSGTSALTGSHMSTLALGFEVQSTASTGVHGHWLLDDQTTLDQLSDSLS